ncbi:MAG: polysaccharide biosynthesis protein [Hyphomonadaceae bacterium]
MRVRIAKFGADGQVQLRPMALEDVIGAAGDGPDLDLVRSVITGRRVLVTGGAGSIGGELTRKLAALGPARLSVIDNSEFNIFQLEQELAALDGAPERSLRYADIRDSAAILRIVEAEQPDLIFHAAAMKHVPLVEQNPCEGVLTNVLGVRNVAEAAARVGAHFVFVSTDKAANPVSVMGATKRLGEIFCQALDREAPAGGPRRLTVRLGNVLGSAGSVAPLFEKQLAQGGPLTITHPDVARYFITISQAADCLLQAAAVGLADETRGAVFVLEMGEPVSVLHLAQDLIRLSGRRPEDIGVRVIGLRPGEKLREELIADDEVATPTISADVKAVSSAMVTLGDIALRFERVIAAARAGSDENVRRVVHAMIAPAHAARRAS